MFFKLSSSARITELDIYFMKLYFCPYLCQLPRFYGHRCTVITVKNMPTHFHFFFLHFAGNDVCDFFELTDNLLKFLNFCKTRKFGLSELEK